MVVKIITDSGCDLPKDILDKYEIEFLPMGVVMNGEERLDGIDLEPKQLFEAMRDGKAPSTTQVSPKALIDLFSKLAQKKESYIYLAFSSQLSGTYQTSKMIFEQVKEEHPNFDLDIIDTKCASLGLGLVVHKAAQLSKEGKSKEEILRSINFHINHVEHIFTVDDLEYLFRGGRVSKTAAFIGGLLNIKPILDVEDGKLIPLEKIRGRKKVFKRIIEIMSERGKNLEDQTVYISHGDDEKGAMEIKSMMEKKFGCKSFLINMIGGVIGSHSGPGTISIFFLNERP